MPSRGSRLSPRRSDRPWWIFWTTFSNDRFRRHTQEATALIVLILNKSYLICCAGKWGTKTYTDTLQPISTQWCHWQDRGKVTVYKGLQCTSGRVHTTYKCQSCPREPLRNENGKTVEGADFGRIRETPYAKLGITGHLHAFGTELFTTGQRRRC